MPDVSRESITAAVLAGGEGSRMGGVDKGLVDLNGRPLVAWALAALQPQVGSLLISANRSLDQYQAFGPPVVPDAGEGFDGPMAGMLAVLQAAQTEFVLTVPCDAPRVPPDLAARLGTALLDADANIAIVEAEGRRQPVHALMRVSVRDSLVDAVADGERKVGRWQDAQGCIRVPCDDIANAFVNVNTLQQRDELAQQLAQEQS